MSSEDTGFQARPPKMGATEYAEAVTDAQTRRDTAAQVAADKRERGLRAIAATVKTFKGLPGVAPAEATDDGESDATAKTSTVDNWEAKAREAVDLDYLTELHEADVQFQDETADLHAGQTQEG